MSFFRGGPPIDDPSFQPLPEEEMAVLDKAAKWFVKWGAAGTIAGIMIGESVKPEAEYRIASGQRQEA